MRLNVLPLRDPAQYQLIEPVGKRRRIFRQLAVEDLRLLQQQERQVTGRALVAGDRRDQDQRDYGAVAARSFDEIFVREDKNLRGRKPGESAANVLEGIRQARAEGARCQRAEPVLEEIYYYRVSPAQGFGQQMLYTTEGECQTHTVRDGDAVIRYTL